VFCFLSKSRAGWASLSGYTKFWPIGCIQKERPDEAVNLAGSLQLQCVPCVLDDLQPAVTSQMPTARNGEHSDVKLVLDSLQYGAESVVFVTFTIPLQSVAQIDGEHLVLVSPENERLLIEYSRTEPC
jgi:hypothetical protein